MKTLKLNTHVKMPMLGLGTWLSKPGEVYKIVKSAIKDGYRHIDCAAIYGNEKEVGQALAEVFAEKTVTRDELFITSKLWNSAHAVPDVIPALKNTLNDLGLGYLDLYLIHWPIAFRPNVTYPNGIEDFISLTEMPIIDTYGEMEKAVSQKLTRSIGVSNFSCKKLRELIESAKIKPAVNQVELHPYLQQQELLQFCKDNDVVLTAYSPLGSSGRPKDMLSGDEKWVLEDSVIKELATKYNRSPAQIVLSWGMSRGTVVIPKTITPLRAIENFKAQDFEIDPNDLAKIAKLDQSYRYLKGDFFTPAGGPYTLENLWD